MDYRYIVAIVVIALLLLVLLFSSLSKRRETWFLPKQMNGYNRHGTKPDSREFLEQLGFKVIGKKGKLRYIVEAPYGWRKKSQDSEFAFHVVDEDGRLKFATHEQINQPVFKAFLTVPQSELIKDGGRN